MTRRNNTPEIVVGAALFCAALAVGLWVLEVILG
jgi:hypothetical protein